MKMLIFAIPAIWLASIVLFLIFGWFDDTATYYKIAALITMGPIVLLLVIGWLTLVVLYYMGLISDPNFNEEPVLPLNDDGV